jgi:D-alanine-D-alanine ligase
VVILKKIRIGVIFGGRSGEHEISLISAESVMRALNKDKYDVLPIGITKEGRWLIGGDPLAQLKAASHTPQELTGGSPKSEVPGPKSGVPTRDLVLGTWNLELGTPSLKPRSPLADVDVVFPVLHGPYGEDGTVQGLLELANLPYVGAEVTASALGMDKALQKTIFRQKGIPVVDFLVVKRREWEREPEAVLARVEAAPGYPCFAKPVNLGSSVGITKARHRHELRTALDIAARYDRRILVEQSAEDCREIEVSVLGNDDPIASIPGEIVPHREFYDYIAKYVDDDTELKIPADLPPPVTARVRELGVQAFLAIDCAGMARVDLFVARDFSRIYVNELNTIPGFTAISMYPQLWEASGLPYPELLDRLIELALERHADKSRSQITSTG